MAQKTFADLDFVGKFSTRNRLEDPVSSDPTGLGSGDAARTWFNSTSKLWKYWDGTAAVDPRARASHSGTQLSSTISDLAATVQAYRLDQFAAATSPITVPNGTTSGQAVNKSQLDAVAASAATGTSIKDPVRVASTANVAVGSTGSGATMDVVTLATNDRILLKDQTTASENGIYVVGASSLSRAADMDATGEVKPGTMVYVNEGTANHDKSYAVTSDVAITVGTTAITWGQIGAGTSYSGTNPIAVSGGAISLQYGTGLTLSGANLIPDFSVVGRKVQGIVPTTTTAPVTVTGAVLTINHNLSNYAPSVTIAAYSAAIAGYTSGDVPFNGATVVDANNVSVTLPAAPVANAWYFSIIG